jgi:hypothetical protein
MNTKLCSRCNQLLPIISFRKNTRYKDGHVSWCKSCYKDHNKIYYLEKKKWTDIQKRYGLTKKEYVKLENKQLGLCACCHQKPTNRGRNGAFVVDHCHRTGAVRGLLCAKCNAGIGFFDDNPDLLQLASFYLESHDNLGSKCSSC